MISQPFMVEINQPDFAIRILGMDILTFSLALIIVLMLAGIAFWYWRQDYKLKQNIQEAKGCVLLEIVPIGGGKVRRVLSPVYKGTAKEVKNKSGATFFISQYAKVNENDAEGYYLIPGHGHLDSYPYNAPERQQITVVKYYFHENDPFPQMPLEPDKWNPERKSEITSTFARISREESVAKAMLGQFGGFFEGLMKALPALQKIPIMFWIVIGIGALVVADIIFNFRNGQSIGDIHKFLMGK